MSLRGSEWREGGYLVVELVVESRGRGLACGGERRERASLWWRAEGVGYLVVKSGGRGLARGGEWRERASLWWRAVESRGRGLARGGERRERASWWWRAEGEG